METLKYVFEFFLIGLLAVSISLSVLFLALKFKIVMFIVIGIGLVFLIAILGALICIGIMLIREDC